MMSPEVIEKFTSKKNNVFYIKKHALYLSRKKKSSSSHNLLLPMPFKKPDITKRETKKAQTKEYRNRYHVYFTLKKLYFNHTIF